jgi:hypothetical protein
MKSYKLKATLVIGIIFVSALPVAYAQDTNPALDPMNLNYTPPSADCANGDCVTAPGTDSTFVPTNPALDPMNFDYTPSSADCANGNCVTAPQGTVNTVSNTGMTNTVTNTGITNTVTNTGTFTLHSPLDPKVTSIGGLVQTFIDVISYILILFAVLMLVYTGLQYILAQGNSEKIKELHGKLLWIVVGVAIVIGARVIIEVVINTLSATHVINNSTLNQVQNAAAGK